MIELPNGDRIAVPTVDLEQLRREGILDPFARYQNRLSMRHLFPPLGNGRCDCGCGRELHGRRTRWATEGCSRAASRAWSIVNSDTRYIAYVLEQLHGRRCKGCDREGGYFTADHVREVADGGGGTWLDNFQLLCDPCHNRKTARSRRARNRRQSPQLNLEGNP